MRLSRKPFGIFIGTVDTHDPGGVVSPACKNSGYYGDGRNGMRNSANFWKSFERTRALKRLS